MIGSDRFRKREVEQHCICKTQSRRKEKGHVDTPATQDAANSRTENEAQTKRCTQQAHPLCAIFFGSNVCDVSLRRRNVTAGNAVEDASQKKHPQRCGKAED